MVFVVTIAIIIYAIYIAIKFFLYLAAGNLITTAIRKAFVGKRKQKEYYFDPSGRVPLTRFKDYCSDEYQEFFKSLRD